MRFESGRRCSYKFLEEFPVTLRRRRPNGFKKRRDVGREEQVNGRSAGFNRFILSCSVYEVLSSYRRQISTILGDPSAVSITAFWSLAAEQLETLRKLNDKGPLLITDSVATQDMTANLNALARHAPHPKLRYCRGSLMFLVALLRRYTSACRACASIRCMQCSDALRLISWMVSQSSQTLSSCKP